MAIDSGRIEAAVTEMLLAIGEDPARAGLETTPRRIAEAYAEYFAGVGADPLDHLRDAGEIDAGAGELGELVLLRDIGFRSMCEHHLLPFTGVAHVAYVPRRRIVGLGRIPRVVETLSSRPQLQERLTEQIADAMQEGLDPLGVLVVLDARHGCVTSRGVHQAASTTVTLATRGVLAEPAQRASTLALIARGVEAADDGAGPASLEAGQA
jgi:GTP cyclohydrolase IA